MKNNSITAQNIWHVGDDQLKEWNVPINDILDYKRAKTEYEGKFDQTINVDLSLSFYMYQTGYQLNLVKFLTKRDRQMYFN